MLDLVYQNGSSWLGLYHSSASSKRCSICRATLPSISLDATKTFRVKGQNIGPDATAYMAACKNPEEKAAWNSGSSQFSNPVLMLCADSG